MQGWEGQTKWIRNHNVRGDGWINSEIRDTSTDTVQAYRQFNTAALSRSGFGRGVKIYGIYIKRHV